MYVKCSARCAASTRSAFPSEYHGSMITSLPSETFTPSARSSFSCAKPRRVGEGSPLDQRVRVRVDDDVDAGALQEAAQLRRVVRLVRAHRGAVARSHAPAEAVLDGVVGHHLEEAAAGVVGLVAVNVDPAAVLPRELEDAVHLSQAEL